MNKYNLNNLKNTVVLLQYNQYDEGNPIYFQWYSIVWDVTSSNILQHFLLFINNILK